MSAMTGSIIIFVITYVFIAFEKLKLDKTSAALLGAAAVIMFGLVPYEDALANVDLNVILLLVGMMLVMSFLADTGVFEWMAVVIAKRSGGNGPAIFLMFLFATAGLSAVLDNVTTVILMAPVTILIAELLVIPAAPFLILEAIASNMGGTATLIGDPPNIIIGSRAGLTFNEFIYHLTPPILIMCVLIFPVLAYIFRKQMHVSDAARSRIDRMRPEEAILDPVGLRNGMIVFVLILAGFFIGRAFHIEPGIVAIAGAIVMGVVSKKDLHHALEKVEWATIFFFVGLFMLISALEHNGLFESIGNYIFEVTGGDFATTVLVILWFAAISSAIVDNIPLVIAMIPLIQTIVPQFAGQMGIADDPEAIRAAVEMPLYWSLALGACLGGNGTLVGASANVVVSQIARRNNYPITFWWFTAYGAPVMIVTLIGSTIYLYLRYLM